MTNFREHDRAIESSPERQQLSAAFSRMTKVGSELEVVRVQLQEERASANAYRAGVGNYARQQHLDRLADLQKAFGRLRHEEEAATAQVAHFKAVVSTRKLEGRVETHRQITANIVNAARTLQDAVIADQRFREQLGKDGLRFEGPLRSMAAYERGGPGWVDLMLPTIEAWLKEMQRTNAYGLSKAKEPRLQIA